MATGRERVEAALRAELGADLEDRRATLRQAMRYGVLNGGKRVRAILVYSAGRALEAPDAYLDVPAMAVELIHAYSLIHDDLPCMDDDDLRRGQPTCHRAFDEATALLAGDALQTLAFEVLTRPAPAALGDQIDARVQLALCRALADASGADGMAGGQAIDLASVGQQVAVADLERMHRYKTGALIRSAVRLGALCAPHADAQRLERLDEYAASIGLAFQIRDDVLDIVGNSEVIGKPQGSDEAKNKPTYPALIGLDASEAMARELHERALAALADLGPVAEPLRLLSAFIVQREH